MIPSIPVPPALVPVPPCKLVLSRPGVYYPIKTFIEIREKVGLRFRDIMHKLIAKITS
jgi:hypothetical protein